MPTEPRDGIWGRVRARGKGRIRPLAGFALLIRILTLALFAPFGAAVLRLFLARWGRCSVGNFEIAEFFLSAPGLAALVVVGSLQVAVLLFDQAGLLLLLGDRGLTARGAARLVLAAAPRILGLAVRLVLRCLLIVVPFLAAMFAVISVLWAGRDLNGLLVLRPPVFWVGAAIGGTLGAAAVALLARFVLSWLLALPALLFEPETTPRAALRASAERSRGRLARAAWPLLLWAAASAAAGAGAALLLRAGSGAVLGRTGDSLPAIVAATAAILLAHLAAGLLLSAAAGAAFAGVVLELHGEAGGRAPAPAAAPAGRRRLWPAAAAALIAALAGTWLLTSGVRSAETVQISAHRAGGAAAPENTLAALRLAIEHGAEWAEIDVQRSADDALVILHDGDLARLGHPGRRVREATLEEIRAIDVGAALDPRFAGERVPLLDEVLAAAAGRIRLNIELKPAGEDEVRPLALAVVEAVRRAGLADRTRVCSQSYASIRLVKETEPAVEIGFIAGAAIGDLAGLDVDFLMVNAKLATRKLVRRAAAGGIAVHAWTVNDPDRLSPLIDRGVANVITDDVPALRARLEEIRDLDLAGRLLLRVRNAFAE